MLSRIIPVAQEEVGTNYKKISSQRPGGPQRKLTLAWDTVYRARSSWFSAWVYWPSFM